MKTSILKFKQEAEQELFSILDYWMQYAIDELNGGFIGKIDNENNVVSSAPKGAVLNARILWSFSAAYNQYKKEKYLHTAVRAFTYISKYFIDKEYGGVFWSVDEKGNMLESKKQIYALAFCMYGLSEFYKASKSNEAIKLALNLYDIIEQHSYDTINKGYIEAFERNWTYADDLRLSAKDANEKKTMNTHLHIIEAYANLYNVHPSADLKYKINELLNLFNEYFIDKKAFHLKLFFDEAWNEKPDVISYGHDIEAAWLLLRCAEIAGHEKEIQVFRKYAIDITVAAAEGLDADGGMWYEYDTLRQLLTKQKHWWVQAEAMVGFFNAFQITGSEKYFQYSLNTWQFIKNYIVDKKYGEWFWGIDNHHLVLPNTDKIGLWKCPYHNARACLEMINRAADFI